MAEFRPQIICAADVVKPVEFETKPWTLNMIYQVEPSLKEFSENALKSKRRNFQKRLNAYIELKCKSGLLIGWDARDPRLRSSDAWDFFFDYIIDELNL